MVKNKKRNLVLLPGLDGTGILFQPLVEQLQNLFYINIISYPTDRLTSLSEMAAMVKTKLNSPEDTVLVAESFSGLVALTLLNQSPIPLRGIIFCAAFAESPRPFLLKVLEWMPVNLFFSPSWVPGIFYRAFCLGLFADHLKIKALRDVLALIPTHVLVHRLRLIAKDSFFPSQSSRFWSIPCVYLQSSQDRLVPKRCADWFAHHFKYFNLIKVDGPHFLLQTKMQQCAKYISEFDQYSQTAIQTASLRSSLRNENQILSP